MICCDRCEEWFHGDCVGISEARGRLMERNGEDYVCPNCYTQKGQFSKAGPSTAAAENGKRPPAGLRKSETSLATPSSTAAATTEEKASDDLGIKGRIEKATNPSGKKKIKIFQPVCCCMKHKFEYCTLVNMAFHGIEEIRIILLVLNTVFDASVHEICQLFLQGFIVSDTLLKSLILT